MEIKVNKNKSKNDQKKNNFHQKEKKSLKKTKNKFFFQKKKDKKKLTLEGVLKKITLFSIFMLFFGIPLFFTGNTFQGIIFEKQIYFYFWVMLGLITWVSRGVLVGKLKIFRTPLDVFIGIFWIVYLIATLLSVDKWKSFWGGTGDLSLSFLSVTALVLFYYLFFGVGGKKVIRTFIWGLMTSGSIAIVWTILAIFKIQFLPDAVAQYAPVSLTGTISGLTLFLAGLLPLFIVTIFRFTRKEKGKSIGTSLIVSLMGIFLVADLFLLFALQGFVLWPAVLVGLGVFVLYIFSRLVDIKSNLSWLPVLIFVIALLSMMIKGVQITKIEIPTEVSPSYNLSYEIAKNSIKTNTFLGSGPATYLHDFVAFKPDNFNYNNFFDLQFNKGTGLFFELISTTGILGIVSFLAGVLSFVGISMYLLVKGDRDNRYYALGLLSSSIIFLVGALSARLEGSVLIIGILIGTATFNYLLLLNKDLRNSVDLSTRISPKYALTLAFIFMVVITGVAFSFVFLGKAFAADVFAGNAVREKQVSIDGSVSMINRAINLNPLQGQYYIRLSQEYMALANSEAVDKDRESINAELVGKYINNSITAGEKAKNSMPNNIKAVENLAQIYENASLFKGEYLELSQKTYEEALALNPNSPRIHLKIGQIKNKMAAISEDEEESDKLITQAKDSFEEALRKKDNFAPAYYNLALTFEQLEEKNKMVENMEKAFVLNKGNLDYIFGLGRAYQFRGEKKDLKNAEILFKKALGINSNNANIHFALGSLYEKNEKFNEAIVEYKKTLNLVPANKKDIREKLERMISNLEMGISNLTENPGANTKQEIDGSLRGDNFQEDKESIESISDSSEDLENETENNKKGDEADEESGND